MQRFLITSVCGWLLFSCSWFCLWVISYYFTNDPELAILLFPFALRTGVALYTSKKYWPAIYSSEWLLMIGLALLLEQPQWFTVLLASIGSIPVLWKAHHFQKNVEYTDSDEWKFLAVMGTVIAITSILNMLAVSNHNSSMAMAVLVTVTGGVMIVPSCYLIYSYLFDRSWAPLTVSMVSRPVDLRSRHVLFYVVLLVLSIALQIGLPEELRRFAPFCLVIPIIVLAFRYGWQGALLGTLVNSIALIAARSSASNMEVTDLLLSLLAQSLTGILLGIGVQKQRLLNAKLRSQLTRNQNLARQLVTAEESVRREIARELHDEIGQNITAIRTQANIIKRVEPTDMGEKCATTIETLSLNIYDTTKGLLTQLRPKTLDDLGVKQAILQLIRELEFEAQGTTVEIEWGDREGDHLWDSLSDACSVTLYRICQEALNNIVKYAQADKVTLCFQLKDHIYLTVQDNGVGFKPEDNLKGLGLRGIKERVQALGGVFEVISHFRPLSIDDSQQCGTRLYVEFPAI